MSTILVGVDPSERYDDAIALAGDLASPSGRIVLATAVPYPPISLVGGAAVAAVADADERDAEEMLARKASLLVGSRRDGPLRAVLLGGVTGRLLQRAGCPVIVTPRGVDRPLAGRFKAATADTARS